MATSARTDTPVPPTAEDIRAFIERLRAAGAALDVIEAAEDLYRQMTPFTVTVQANAGAPKRFTVHAGERVIVEAWRHPRGQTYLDARVEPYRPRPWWRRLLGRGGR